MSLRLSYIVALICAITFLAACASARPMVFPGKDWAESAPEAQGVDSAKLKEAIDWLKANAGRDGVSEFVIVRNGVMIHKGDNIDKVHGVWSMTKSFTSTVLGLLIDDGKAALDTRAKDVVPSMAKDFPDVALAHFAAMTSGYRAIGDAPKGNYAHGPSSTPFVPGEALFAPGTMYAYWDSAMNQYGNVLTRVGGERMADLFKRRIADPIGMDETQWRWGDFGSVDGLVVNGGSGNSNRHIFISARQMARFGHLYLNRGMWDGKRLLSSEWVDTATRNHVPADLPLGHPESGIDGRGVYGCNWWVNGLRADGRRLWPGAPAGAFAASGHNNNKMFVIPEWRMVIVRLGLDQADRVIGNEVWSEFIEKVGDAITGAPGPLRVHETNPRYFTDGRGRAVYLTGSHTWNNLVDMGKDDPPSPFDFDACLDWMQKLNHNFIRLWTWESVTWDTANNQRKGLNHTRPHPWPRTGPGDALDGKPKFDLSRFNDEYFTRLRRRVEEAGRRDIYVAVMLFEGWGMQFAPGAWQTHPFNPNNNINGIDADTDGDGKGLEVHQLANPDVTALQEAYVRKVIDTINDLDNVLYEIGNEIHPSSTDWQYHMIRFIKDYQKGKPKQHPVGMTFQYRGGSNKTLFDSPADWVSPNPEGGWRDNPPAADGKKVVLSDTDHLWGIGGNRAWVWKTFLRGNCPIFMDPYDGLILGDGNNPQWESVRQSMGQTLYYADRMDLAAMTPQSDMSSTGYCLAGPGEILVYCPADTRRTFTVKLAPARWELEWFNCTAGRVIRRGQIDAKEAAVTFESPVPGDAVLYLRTP